MTFVVSPSVSGFSYGVPFLVIGAENAAEVADVPVVTSLRRVGKEVMPLHVADTLGPVRVSDTWIRTVEDDYDQRVKVVLLREPLPREVSAEDAGIVEGVQGPDFPPWAGMLLGQQLHCAIRDVPVTVGDEMGDVGVQFSAPSSLLEWADQIVTPRRRKGDCGIGDVTVRDAVHADIPGICATMPEAFGLMGAGWQDPDYVAKGLQSCAAGLSGRQKIKVAVMGEDVVGCSFSGLALAPDGEKAHTEIGIVHGIAVRPAIRRQGVAAALLSACEQYLGVEGARVMIAEVRPRATGFFAARGYQPAQGPALLIPSAEGKYIHQQSIFSTALMWKSCRADDAVVPRRTGRGTVLEGLRDN